MVCMLGRCPTRRAYIHRVRAISLLLLLVVLGLAGCGAVDDAKQEATKKIAEIKDKAKELRKDLDRLRHKVTDKVNTALADIRNVLPKADANTPVPRLQLDAPKDPLLEIEDNVHH